MTANLIGLLLLAVAFVCGELVVLDDGGQHVVEQDYGMHNILVANGTTLTLDGQIISAPESNDEGEDAVRVVDATFHAISGTITGGHEIGGTGVTITTTRRSPYPPGAATFEAGVEVYGGDAVRELTTKGGDAVQIIQSGSVATFNGGKFVAGTGCSVKVCGVAVDDGVALHVIQGKAVVKGGTFEGVFENISGEIQLHGCVVYNEDTEVISGVLADGSEINVVYKQPKGQNGKPVIVYEPSVCPQKAPESPPNKGRKTAMVAKLVLACVGVLGCILLR